MKKRFLHAKALALLCTCLLTQNLFAQNTAWSTTANIGIGTTTAPTNPAKLNITSTTVGNSGLRFGNLNSSTSVSANTTGKLLTLNASGDVVLSGVVNYWTLSGANLYNNAGTNVGIGTITPIAKLNVDGGNVVFGNTNTLGPKLLWSNAKSALRVGIQDEADWSDANIGSGSCSIGYATNANGTYAFSSGLESGASGQASAAFGTGTSAQGNSSFALGDYTTANGGSSIAIGSISNANGAASLAGGLESSAVGNYSFAMGHDAVSSSYNSFVIGAYNIGGGNATTWVAADPLFEIGNGNANTTSNALTVYKNGKMKIGTLSVMPGTYNLYVAGGILTEKIKAALSTGTQWSDYVFEKNYKLIPLAEVEAFVNANKHLPGVPSADELVKDGGIDMNEMFAKQMEKIEELTLYIIEQNKQMELMKSQIAKLQVK